MRNALMAAALRVKERIEKANIVTAQGPTSVLNEEQGSSSPASTSMTGSSTRVQTTATLHKDTAEETNSEMIEDYFKSQSELKAQIERQYLDTLARNEFADHPSSPTIPSNSMKMTDVTDASVLKTMVGLPSLTVPETGTANPLKRKWTDTSNSTNDATTSSPAGLGATMPSAPRHSKSRADEDEFEILSRLPPLDPAQLAEYADFAFEPETRTTTELENKSPSPNYSFNQPIAYQTDPYSHNKEWAQHPLETSSLNPPALPPAQFTGKIDWGSDTEEDSEEEELSVWPVVGAAEESLQPLSSVNEVRVDPVPEDGGGDGVGGPVTAESSEWAEYVEPRAVEEAEVERLHWEDVAGLNGNLDKWGRFREWQETLTVQNTYGNKNDLLILPYTVIDF